ncbi:MAG TPA: aminotransferase class V-fold PLP-dependent enzyme [Bryobacteraceae bacterium]|nr:aminotransferase class V-fold PLP-dependent enzyme [Bryobacteraceae bacterium]
MTRRQLLATTIALPSPALLRRDPELYWKRIRADQFLLPEWRVYLNNGSLGVPPKSVLAAVQESLTRGASLVDDHYPRWGYETLDDLRTELAAWLGCGKDELALTHNATEAMSTIANGLDLKAGDEVVITDQEHPSGRNPWLLKQARYGISVREVPIPLPPKSPDQLADLITSAIGPRTRVLSFSGITTTTGLITPVRQICEAARAKGVISVVDGAHMNGQIPLRISEFNCDFFAGSPHKWLFAPPGCGLLYIRESMLDRLWPNVETGGWDDRTLKAGRFMRYGTNNISIFDGLRAGLRFHQALGPEVIFDRIHSLAQGVRKQAAARTYVELLTPGDERMYGAMVTFRIRRGDTKPLFEACARRRIWISGGADRVRISTHIHTRPADVEAFFTTLDEVYG